MAKKSTKQSAWGLFREFEQSGNCGQLPQWEFLWQTLESTGLNYDLLEPIQHDSGTLFQSMLLGLYAYAPSSRAFIQDMVEAYGAQGNLVRGILDATASEQYFPDLFMEQMDDLFEWGMAHGGRFDRLPSVNKVRPDISQWVYDKTCKHKGGKAWLIQHGSLHDLCSVGISLLRDCGRSDLVAQFGQLANYQEREAWMYGWLKEEFGLKVAFPKAFRESRYHSTNPAQALYSYLDLAEMFTGGDILKLVGLHRESSSEATRNMSKTAMLLILSQPKYWDILAGAERSLMAHWRKSGVLDDVQWMQLVETTDAQKEGFLARDLGL
ncbi:hypothetical protein [Pseudomonas sp. S1(2024)]|uniref:hypothetical protein n=1 Tax=Pseudomonas sp. S1(2024) TaxID=3390191 RepID=UPI003979447E